MSSQKHKLSVANREYGRLLRIRRKQRGEQAHEAAVALSMGIDRYYDIERGKRDLKLSEMLRINMYYGIGTQELIDIGFLTAIIKGE